MTIQKSTTQEIQLTTHDGTPMVSSLTVAEKFGKRHDNVLQSIEKLKGDCPVEFGLLNFQGVEYVDAKGEKRPMVAMTRDGFSLLAMGFTGAKAVQWKIRFINAFNVMERHILQEAKAELRKARQAARQCQLEWQQARATGKLIRREETDTIREFISYAKGQGSRNAEMYFLSLSAMVNRELFGLEPKNTPEHFRDTLDAAQLGHIRMADIAVARALTEGMAKTLPYKAVFAFAKERVRTLVQMVGRPSPIMLQEPANTLCLLEVVA
ncbi:MAG: Rha family transcriptional regulator [Magnetococcales bacterium]|nr:Rha family transcriptional regulator [Magnetococcales bacterium]